MIQGTLYILVILPLLAFMVSLIIPRRSEKIMASFAFGTVLIHFVLSSLFILNWLFFAPSHLDEKDLTIIKSEHFEFFIDFYFDKITAVFLIVGSFLTLLVARYSRYYMHRESGYKRFFNTLLFFFCGYNTAVLAGNFETLCIGWEFLGLSSFLLIAFYRDRYLPVKNAVKVFSIYRLGDVGIIMAMWLSHHLWSEAVTFGNLLDMASVQAHLNEHSVIGVVIGVTLLGTAAAKSAQFPFTSWLPRAMEGPTPSSAIFYGSLSVHLGVYLLLRTFPLWENQYVVRWLIGITGVITAFIASGIARVQPTIKSQIAYASASQIGIMFLEVSLGWTTLALIHFAGNAFLRTYQLLVSPSVVSYLIREQFFNYSPNDYSIEDRLPVRWGNTLYVLSLKEYNLDNFLYRYCWIPLKKIGKSMDRIKSTWGISMLVSFILIALILRWKAAIFTENHKEIFAILFALAGLILVLKAFTERHRVHFAWWLVVTNHLWVSTAVSFNEHYDFTHDIIYLSGILFSGLVGHFVLQYFKKKNHRLDLNRFHGLSKEFPIASFILLLCSLAVAGFPITPSFIGEDMIMSHIHEHQFMLALAVSFSFIVDGLALMRIYARICMGSDAHSIFDSSYRSS